MWRDVLTIGLLACGVAMTAAWCGLLSLEAFRAISLWM
jgi:hypothetical protein